MDYDRVLKLVFIGGGFLLFDFLVIKISIGVFFKLGRVVVFDWLFIFKVVLFESYKIIFICMKGKK